MVNLEVQDLGQAIQVHKVLQVVTQELKHLDKFQAVGILVHNHHREAIQALKADMTHKDLLLVDTHQHKGHKMTFLVDNVRLQEPRATQVEDPIRHSQEDNLVDSNHQLESTCLR